MKEMEIEVYKSLLEVKILLGVPKNILISTTIVFAAVLVVTENIIILPLWIITHFIEVVFSRKDPQFIPIYINKLDRSNYFNS